jgi:hypothetical protein
LTSHVTLLKVEGVKSVKDYFLPKKKGDTCGTTDNLKLVAKISTELIKDKEISSTRIEVKKPSAPARGFFQRKSLFGHSSPLFRAGHSGFFT